jgi:signal transduction histidine kinase
MLQFSRGVLSEQSLTDLADVLDRAVELVGDECDTKKQFDFGDIKIDRQYDPDLPETICAKTEIQQVIVNMLTNAAHAVGLSEPGTERCITLRTMRQDQWARIEIEDNGSGISEDVRKRIFEPFFTTKDVGEGTGLGLFVAYFIITSKHHGTIDVQSESGQGAKFTIRLPLKTESNRSTMRTSEDDV